MRRTNESARFCNGHCPPAGDIFIETIRKNKNRVVYEYRYSDSLRDYFNSHEPFFIEWDIDKPDSVPSRFSAEDIPDGILVIPFLGNILPIAWVLGAAVHIDVIDKSFYESIPEFKNGYKNMYPAIDFSGELLVGKIMDYTSVVAEKKRNLAFFSGGVDSFNTLVNHYKEQLLLMTLWGSDVFFDDISGWNNVKEHIHKTAEQFGLEYVLIKSNFRKFLNENLLTKLVRKRAGDGWWHGFQHGIGLIAHAAPLAYYHAADAIYIASSLTIDNRFTCASDPTIDNYVRIANSRTVHDGYEFSRQNKIKNICEFVRTTQMEISLRVCWESTGGNNCNNCEKCFRTAMSIIAEREEPDDFNLLYSKKQAGKIKKFILYKIMMDDVQKAFWKDIQKRFIQNGINRPELRWILKTDFDRINRNPVKCMYIATGRITRKLKRIMHKAGNFLERKKT
jgi:hypothetical protein